MARGSKVQTPETPQGPPPTPFEARKQLIEEEEMVTVVEPRVGGVIRISEKTREAWTGGSNIRKVYMPFNVMCRRPLEFKAMATVQEKCTQGLDAQFKLAAFDEQSSVLLTTWIEMLEKSMKILGMDTIFKIPKSNQTAEQDLLRNLTALPHADVDAWVSELKEGANACPYDIQNLDWSGMYIYNSVTKKLYDDIVDSIGTSESGPRVLQEIICIKQQTDAGGIRAMETKLQTLSLAKEPAENVAEFTKKVKAIAKLLSNFKDGYGNPRIVDLSTMVSKCYISSTVEVFRTEANRFHIKATRNPSSVRWEDVTKDLLTLYRSLLGQPSGWPPALTKRSSHDMNVVQSINNLTTKLSSIESKLKENNNNSHNNANNNNSEIRCHDCGKPNVKKGHPGCTQPGKGLHVPSNKKNNGNGKSNNSSTPKKFPPTPGPNDPKEIKFDGKDWIYCEKCRKGKGSWYIKGSTKAHSTSEHRNGKSANLCITNVVPTIKNETVTPVTAPTSRRVHFDIPYSLSAEQQSEIDNVELTGRLSLFQNISTMEELKLKPDKDFEEEVVDLMEPDSQYEVMSRIMSHAKGKSKV